ncbi:BTAD domain-containing putative transcriptional regulator [Streptacidiphilus sp. EB129]|uniref:ATP-binding protein n=1 Tax=Streptacidiphilus sp. EB129 TaxID=3156262 RepID=UPI003518C4E9
MTTELTLLPRVALRGQEITGPRLRGLLALLAGNLRGGCSVARLVDGLWPEEQPENPGKALQVLVSRARSQFGAELIASTATGYRLALRDDQVDAAALPLAAADCALHAQAGDHAAALARAEAGLALWSADGDRDGGGTGDPVAELRAERRPAYWALARNRALALARLGRRDEAVTALAGLAREYPRDEEILVELLRCEAATSGPSAALARFEHYRRTLRDELGTDPGAALRSVHQQLLTAEAPLVRAGVAHEPNELLGRERDLAAIGALLRSSRVTSIVGAGGLGKTRLANAVSRDADQRVVQFVALAGITDDGDVVSEVASVLGVRDSRPATLRGPAIPADLLAGVAAALGPGPALLVLDNCEQVVRGVAELVRALVSTTPDLRVLTTSRTPLGLSSESVYPLPELSPAMTVELFDQRARAARPGAELPAHEVRELCRHLDGLPLAVELAAARVRVMSVAEITRRLTDRFTLLRGGARDAPERHRTLQAVVDWSWNLLEPEGRRALRLLSVFPDGFTAEAARFLLGDEASGARDPLEAPDVLETLEVLENLADQSLLKVAGTPSGTRFRMLETVREFSAARRESDAETARATEGFLGWVRAYGRSHHDAVFGADPVPVLERVRAEQDNLLTALRLGLATGDGAAAVAASALLAGLWSVESNYARLGVLTEDIGPLLSHFRPGPEDLEVTRTAAVLSTAATFLTLGPRAVRALVVLRRMPPQERKSLVGDIATVLAASPDGPGPDHPALRALCDDPDPHLAGVANVLAAYRWHNQGEPERALAAGHRIVDAFDTPATPLMRVLALGLLGDLCLQVGRGGEALRHLTGALDMMERLGDRSESVGIRWGIVLAHLQLGSVDEAERWLALAAADLTDEDPGTYSFALGVRAEILISRGEVGAGLELWREAVGRLTDDRSPDSPVDPALAPWLMECQAVTVVAHARHGRLDQVRGLVDGLPRRLAALLGDPLEPSPSLAESPLCGTLVLALVLADLADLTDPTDPTNPTDRSEPAAGTDARRAWCAGGVALAERLRFRCGFQPTMSPGPARESAENADGPAYAEAVSAYADLTRPELWSTAVALLQEREQQRGPEQQRDT